MKDGLPVQLQDFVLLLSVSVERLTEYRGCVWNVLLLTGILQRWMKMVRKGSDPEFPAELALCAVQKFTYCLEKSL